MCVAYSAANGPRSRTGGGRSSFTEEGHLRATAVVALAICHPASPPPIPELSEPPCLVLVFLVMAHSSRTEPLASLALPLFSTVFFFRANHTAGFGVSQSAGRAAERLELRGRVSRDISPRFAAGWFEAGAGVHCELGRGLRYRAYVMTPLDAAGFSADEGGARGPAEGVPRRTSGTWPPPRPVRGPRAGDGLRIAR